MRAHALLVLPLLLVGACDGCRADGGIEGLELAVEATADLAGCEPQQVVAVDAARALVLCRFAEAPSLQLALVVDGRGQWSVELPCAKEDVSNVALTAGPDVVTVRCVEQGSRLHSFALNTDDGALRWRGARTEVAELAVRAVSSIRVGATVVEVERGGRARGLDAATGERLWQLDDSLVSPAAGLMSFPGTELITWRQDGGGHGTAVRHARSGEERVRHDFAEVCFLPDGFVVGGPTPSSIVRVGLDGARTQLELPEAAFRYGSVQECGVRGDDLVVVVNPREGPVRFFRLPTEPEARGITVHGALTLPLLRSEATELPRFLPVEAHSATLAVVDIDELRVAHTFDFHELAAPTGAAGGRLRVALRLGPDFIIAGGYRLHRFSGIDGTITMAPGEFARTFWWLGLADAQRDGTLFAPRTDDAYVMSRLEVVRFSERFELPRPERPDATLDAETVSHFGRRLSSPR